MQRSEHRILTTHAGSLPRPVALTRLYARRAAGETVDEKEIDAQARDATHAIVRKQIETGLDVIDDGEQSRESFVLYMRHRLTGLGGTGSRPMHADLDAYPEYKSAFQQRVTSPDRVSNRANLPKAVGAIAREIPRGGEETTSWSRPSTSSATSAWAPGNSAPSAATRASETSLAADALPSVRVNSFH